MDPKTYLAQTAIDIGQIGGPTGFGPWGNLGKIGTDIAETATEFTKTISRIIGVMTIVAGIWFIFTLIIGAFSFLTAGGNEESMKKASNKIGQGILGLVFVVISYAIISLLGALLGFKILDPQDIIILLKP